MTNDKDFYVKYLATLIELNKIHSGKWNGKTIITPTLISENLCKYLLNLEDREPGTKDHDAIKDGKKYEIKATSSKKGTTTYNPNSNVDYFIWIYFNYENEELEISQISREEFKNCPSNVDKTEFDDEEIVIKAKDFEKSERKTLQLSKVKTCQTTRFFCMKSLKELKKENNNDTSKI